MAGCLIFIAAILFLLVMILAFGWIGFLIDVIIILVCVAVAMNE